MTMMMMTRSVLCVTALLLIQTPNLSHTALCHRRGLFSSVADVLQTPFDIASAVVSAPFEVAGKVVEAVKPIAGETLTDMAQQQLDVWGEVFQLPISLGSDFAKLPFELISGIGEDTTGHGGLSCCEDVPHLNEMMNEVEKLHEVVAACSERIGEAILGVTQAKTRQARGIFSADSALYSILTKPIDIAASVAQLPFKVVGEGVKIPLKVVQSVVEAASPLLGERLSSILRVPLDTLSKFAALPFEIGAEFVQMPFGVAEDLAKLPFGSAEEAAAAKYCCGRMNMADQLLVSTKQLREAAELCAGQLEQIVTAVSTEFTPAVAVAVVQ